MSFVAVASIYVPAGSAGGAKLLYFENCEYCQRATDHCQQSAQCKSCGAPLKQRNRVRMEAPAPAVAIPAQSHELPKIPKRGDSPFWWIVLCAISVPFGFAFGIAELVVLLQWVFSK